MKNTIQTIADVPEAFTLVQGEQDVERLREYIGTRQAMKYDGFFTLNSLGEFIHVYGFRGSIPVLTKRVHKIKLRN